MWYNINVAIIAMLIFIVRWIGMRFVAGISTLAPVAQLDRALACGAKGRRFESCRVYQRKYSSSR